MIKYIKLSISFVFVFLSKFGICQVYYDNVAMPIFNAKDLNLKGNVKSIKELSKETNDNTYTHNFNESIIKSGSSQIKFYFLETGQLESKIYKSVGFSNSDLNYKVAQRNFKEGEITNETHTEWKYNLSYKDSIERNTKRNIKRKLSDYMIDNSGYYRLYDSATGKCIGAMIFDSTKRLLYNHDIDSIAEDDGLDVVYYTTFIYDYNKDGKVVSVSALNDKEFQSMWEWRFSDFPDLDGKKNVAPANTSHTQDHQSYLLIAKKNAKAEQAKYDYNKNGDVSKIIYLEDGKPTETFIFSYTYDAKGNWITCTAKIKVKDKTLYDSDYIVMARLIEYYE